MNIRRDAAGRILAWEPGPGEAMPSLEVAIVQARALGDDATADELERRYLARAVLAPRPSGAQAPMRAPPGINGGETAEEYYRRKDAEGRC